MFELRRVDELGRVAIPKAMRQQMKVEEGMPMIVSNVGNDFITFTKYNPNAIQVEKTPSEILKEAVQEMAFYASESEYETEFYEIMDEIAKLMDECKEIENK